MRVQVYGPTNRIAVIKWSSQGLFGGLRVELHQNSELEHKSSCPQTWRLTSAIEQSFKRNISYSFQLSTRLSSLSWELEQYFEWPESWKIRLVCWTFQHFFFQLTDWLAEKKSGTTINHFKILEQVQKEEYSKKGKVWKILSRFWCKFIQLFLSDFLSSPRQLPKSNHLWILAWICSSLRSPCWSTKRLKIDFEMESRGWFLSSLAGRKPMIDSGCPLQPPITIRFPYSLCVCIGELIEYSSVPLCSTDRVDQNTLADRFEWA